jgi:hypothetical protein
MKISFSNSPSRYSPNTTVEFDAEFDGVRVACEISDLALTDHFGAISMDGDALVAAFESNRASIEAAARIKLPARVASGRCLLITEDF